MTDGEINFYSISSDGRVFNWVLMQSKLGITTIITLYMDTQQTEVPGGTKQKLKGNNILFPFTHSLLLSFIFVKVVVLA